MLIHIDEVALSYSIRELVDRGTVIRRVRLTRPHVVGAKMPDGRWDLGALVKRESREQERTGPGRPIQIQSIEVFDGHVYLRDPLDFGAAHVPTDFQRLNASLLVHLRARAVDARLRARVVGRPRARALRRIR